ncbi:MAG: ParB/RepB/Spo0J family partition protein [Candidatus Nealsonbacteria bacterium]|nr:ParB/RepB/Spo0J family partition protein [Candidatus Nealsonbacteria bacterium]
MSKQRRLGRGLEALLGRAPAPADPPEQPPVERQPIEQQAKRQPPIRQQPAEQAPVEHAPVEHAPIEQAPVEQFAMPDVDEAPPVDEALPVDEAPPIAQAPAVSSPPPAPLATGTQPLNVHQIDSNPSQPRQDFDAEEMRSLSESLSAHGLLQPVVVRQVDDRYELVAGERRLRAAVQAGWTEVPANVIEASDRESAELAVVENLQRADLNPLEKAASFQRYLQQYGCTQGELAGRLKMDRSTIANLIRLLELPEPVRDAIRSGRITQGHARALLPLGEEHEQIAFCQRIQREGLNVRQTESAVQEAVAAADGKPLGVVDRQGNATRQRPATSEHLAALEQELRSALGAKVRLTHNARGRGKLVIHFRNHTEFERLRVHLTGSSPGDLRSHAG